MTNEYVLATNDDGDLAVRTVNATESSAVTDTNNVITRTDDGKLAIRVVGGGDSHNKGYFATQAALEEAYPTGEAGDYAIVGATDTVWLWDDDTSAWKDSDTKGQVTSVNNQTGDVTLTIPDAVQYSTMPTASVDNLGDIVQFTGTTDANYTNGYFYKCVSDGQDPATYSWSQVSVQPTPEPLPSQTGQSGKFLTTDGTDASWSDKPLVNNATAPLLSVATGNLSVASASNCAAYGADAKATKSRSVAVGQGASSNGTGTIVVGRAAVSSDNTILLNATEGVGLTILNDPHTMYVVINNGEYLKLLSADGTIPADRLIHAINKYSTMPTASASNEGWIVQFTGTTDSTYTHGHLYECVSDGQDPATYSWTEVQLGGGGASYTAGTGIDITSGVISAADPVLVNKAQASNTDVIAIGTSNLSSTVTGSVLVGTATRATNAIRGVAIGHNARLQSGADYAIAVGWGAYSSASHAIQLGATTSGTANSDANTFKVANANGNFELMNANGNLPADRLASTTGLADGNYRLRLVMASGVPTLEWVAE